jgi:hypothetical protein
MIERWTPKIKPSLTGDGNELRMWTDKEGDYVLYTDYIKKGNEYTINTRENILLEAVKASYRKHHLSSIDIGWDELSDILLNALCVALGDKGFQDWLKLVNR